jgi:hypothetical protein
MQPQILQCGGGRAGGVTLIAHDDDMAVVGGSRAALVGSIFDPAYAEWLPERGGERHDGMRLRPARRPGGNCRLLRRQRAFGAAPREAGNAS